MIQTTGGDRTVTVILKMAASNYIAGARASAAETAKLQAAQKGATTVTGELGQGMSTLTKTLIGVAGLKIALGATAGAAIEWESAFAGVTKTVEGTPQQLAEISDGLRQMSKELPTSAEELAGIAESAGQLGIETPNVLGFTKVIADLGETTNLAGQEGATQLARLANITQMSQTDFDRLGSTIVALGNSLATTEAEIVSMGLRIAGAGKQVGLTEGEILALAGALSSVGIEAEAGGTAISKVMIDIASEVENSGDKLATFARVAGMTADEFSQAWRDDAARALQAFISGLGNMENQGQSTLSVLEELDITEVRMRDALLRSSGASGVLTDALDLQADAWRDNNALTEEAGKRYETTAAKIDMAKNAVLDLGREQGSFFAEQVDYLAEWVAQTANGFGSFTQDVEGVVKTIFGMDDAWDHLGRGAHVLDNFTEDWREYTIVADDAGIATEDLGGKVEMAEGQIDDLSRALNGFVTPLETYQDMVQNAAETTAKSTKSSKDNWRDYAASAKVSLTEFTQALQKQVSDLHAWEDNLVTIAERTNAGFALQLAELGPEAAGLVAQMADATDSELAELQHLFGERAEASGADYVNRLANRLGDAAGAADEAVAAAVAAVTVYEDMYDAAILTADGWVRGIYDKTAAMEQAAAYAARRATNAARAELGIESPSKVWWEMARFMIEGGVLGLIDNEDSLADAVKRVVGKAMDSVGSIAGAIRASMGIGGGLADANATLEDLLRRREALPTDIGVVQMWVDQEAERSAAITPSEEAAILRAQRRVADAQDRLSEAQQDGSLSAIDLRLAELAVIEAREDLTRAQEDAVAPTRKLLDLQEQLRDLKSEYAHIDEAIAKAREDLTLAELRAIDAEADLLMSQQELLELGPAGEQLFRDLATAAGVTEERIDRLIASYRELARVAAGRSDSIGGTLSDGVGSVGDQVAALRASLGLGADPVSDKIWVDRLASGRADWDTVVRRLEDKARLFDNGGIWPSGTLGINRSGQDEHVFTSRQLQAFAQPSVGTSIGSQVTIAEGAIQIMADRPRDAAGQLRAELRRIELQHV